MMSASGLAFSLANILLARGLAPGPFAMLSLMLALVQIAWACGPGGIDLTIIRHHLRASARVIVAVMATSAVVAIALAIVAAEQYRMSSELVVCIASSAVAAAVTRTGAAFLRSRGRLVSSLFLSQVQSFVLLLLAGGVLLAHSADAFGPAIVITGTYVLTALGGVHLAREHAGTGADLPRFSVLLRDSFAASGIVIAIQLLWQLERIVIPRLLSNQDLAMFAAAAAIAAGPFRMIQMGSQHAPIPALRASRDRRHALQILRTEVAAIALSAVGALFVACWLTPLVLRSVLDDRYRLAPGLLSAFAITGIVKVVHGMVVAIVQARGSTAALGRLNVASWFGLGLAVLFSCVGAESYGVSGVVFGAGVGWLTTTIAASTYAWSLLGSSPAWQRAELAAREG
jgi:O-antigen/teichoic acid export membrane protein